MRTWRMWRGRLAVLAGLGAVFLALAAEPAESTAPANKTANGTWFPFWSGSTDKAAKKSPAKSEKEVEPDLTTPPPGPRRDRGVGERGREKDTLLRRLEVCDKLREIALQKNDNQLLRQAEQLDERCWQIYMQRIAHLPVSKAVSDDRPAPRTDGDLSAPATGERTLSIPK